MVSIDDTLPRGQLKKMRLLIKESTPSRFQRWAWSEIPAYRLALTLGYLMTVYFGVSAIIAGVPAFTLEAPEGWTPIWGSMLVLGAGVAAIGSLADHKPFSHLELVGSWAVSVGLVAYVGTILYIAYSLGDAGRAAVGSGLTIGLVTVLIRMFWLMVNVLPRRKGIAPTEGE